MEPVAQIISALNVARRVSEVIGILGMWEDPTVLAQEERFPCPFAAFHHEMARTTKSWRWLKKRRHTHRSIYLAAMCDEAEHKQALRDACPTLKLTGDAPNVVSKTTT